MRKYYLLLKKNFVVIFCMILFPGLIFPQKIQVAISSKKIAKFPETTCQSIQSGIVNSGKALTVDTTRCYTWAFNGSDWDIQSITINTYNDEGKVTEAVLKNFDAQFEQFLPVRRYSYEYFEDGILKTE